jgi:hypothetical protein
MTGGPRVIKSLRKNVSGFPLSSPLSYRTDVDPGTLKGHAEFLIW